MSNPVDDHFNEAIKALSEGPEAMEDWLKDLQEKVGAPDGLELPDSIEIEYEDGTKETIDTTKPVAGQGRFPQFYSYDNPAPQEVIDRWSEGEDEDEYFDDDGNQIKPFDHQIPIVDPDLSHDEDDEE